MMRPEGSNGKEEEDIQSRVQASSLLKNRLGLKFLA